MQEGGKVIIDLQFLNEMTEQEKVSLYF